MPTLRELREGLDAEHKARRGASRGYVTVAELAAMVDELTRQGAIAAADGDLSFLKGRANAELASDDGSSWDRPGSKIDPEVRPRVRDVDLDALRDLLKDAQARLRPNQDQDVVTRDDLWTIVDEIERRREVLRRISAAPTRARATELLGKLRLS